MFDKLFQVFLTVEEPFLLNKADPKKVITLQHIIFAARKEGKFPFNICVTLPLMVRIYKAKSNFFSSRIPFTGIEFYNKILKQLSWGVLKNYYSVKVYKVLEKYLWRCSHGFKCSKLPKKRQGHALGICSNKHLLHRLWTLSLLAQGMNTTLTRNSRMLKAHDKNCRTFCEICPRLIPVPIGLVLTFSAFHFDVILLQKYVIINCSIRTDFKCKTLSSSEPSKPCTIAMPFLKVMFSSAIVVYK